MKMGDCRQHYAVDNTCLCPNCDRPAFDTDEQNDAYLANGKAQTTKQREIFVFGSNLAGRHGAGAALAAVKQYGAIYGQGVGLQGDSYGIPTKDARIQTLPLTHIKRYVSQFLDFARANQGLTFNVTRIGCGLAGYSDLDIAPLFVNAPRNCNLHEGWRQIGPEIVEIETAFYEIAEQRDVAVTALTKALDCEPWEECDEDGDRKCFFCGVWEKGEDDRNQQYHGTDCAWQEFSCRAEDSNV